MVWDDDATLESPVAVQGHRVDCRCDPLSWGALECGGGCGFASGLFVSGQRTLKRPDWALGGRGLRAGAPRGTDLHAIAKRLLEKEVLEGEELEQLLTERESADVLTGQFAKAFARRGGTNDSPRGFERSNG